MTFIMRRRKKSKWSRRNAFSGRAGHRLLRDEKMIKCPFRTGNNPAGSASNARESPPEEGQLKSVVAGTEAARGAEGATAPLPPA
jgi:hypothetical protein